MRILVIYQYYLMPGMPGGSRYNEFCRMWADAGHQVTVITGNLDYASGEVPARLRGRGVVRELDGSVEVFRCPVPQSYRSGYAGRAYAYLGFASAATVTAQRVPRPDVIIASSPPLLTAAVGLAAAAAHREPVPLVFEVRDLWPESAVTTGVLKAENPITKGLYALEALAYRGADVVNVLTPAFRRDILDRKLCDAERIRCIPNGADAKMFTPQSRDQPIRRELGWGDRFVVMYAGAHGRANALDQLIDAAVLLRERQDILIACVGDGPERLRLEERTRSLGLTNMQFCGSFAKERMPEVVNASDVGAAVLQDNPTFRTVYPNKVFDYMACERPALLAIDGVIRELVCDQANAGVFAAPENPQQLASAIEQLADNPQMRSEMGARGRAWVIAHLSRDALAAEYLQMLQELAQIKRSRIAATLSGPL